jgi:hypothetical protein
MSTRYVCSQIIPADLRTAPGMDGVVKSTFLAQARGQGFTPASDIALDWHEITRVEIGLELATHDLRMLDSP